jgi:beta-glucoside operon transcriptional antiterminator
MSLINNLVLAYDEEQEELVLFGTGIGFKKKKGDMVDPSLVSNVFQATSYDQNLSDILKDISPNVSSATERINDLTGKNMDKKLNNSLLVSLADNLQSAISEKSNDIFFTASNLLE